MTASETGHALLRLCIRLKNAAMEPSPKLKNALLRDAVCACEAARVRFLMAQGVDVNSADEKGMTPVMLAAQRGSPEIVRLLIDAGAEVDRRDPLGYTAADLAMWHSEYRMGAYTPESQEIVRLLRDASCP